jgi:hypothetical protein
MEHQIMQELMVLGGWNELTCRSSMDATMSTSALLSTSTLIQPSFLT